VPSAKCSYLALILVRKLRQPLSLSDSPINPQIGSQFNPQFGFCCKLGQVSCKLGQVTLSPSDSPIDPQIESQFNAQFGFSCKLGQGSCKLGQVSWSLQLTLRSTLILGLSLTLSSGSLYVNFVYPSILFLGTDKSF
jgi:hypothetical protein